MHSMQMLVDCAFATWLLRTLLTYFSKLPQARHPPRSLTMALGHEVEKYDQLCDALESQLVSLAISWASYAITAYSL